ncbi:MAG: hypothetical protein ACO1N0_10765 [Fluviicola sp.]
MNNQIIAQIDTLIAAIKNKIASDGYSAADLFIILTFELFRAELSIGKVSNDTVGALNEISATTSHFYYFRDFKGIYEQLQTVYAEISKPDSRFFDSDLESKINFELSSWKEYLTNETGKLLDDLPAAYSN